MDDIFVYTVYAMTYDYYDYGAVHSVHAKPECAIATAGLIMSTEISGVGTISQTWVEETPICRRPVQLRPNGREIVRYDAYTIMMIRQYAERQGK